MLPESKTLSLRFSIRSHIVPVDSDRQDHWDFFLESDQRLLSWEIQPFENNLPAQIQATRRKDHRIKYLDYQGPISKDRGILYAIDLGALHWETLSEDLVSGTISGKIFNGSFQIERKLNKNDPYGTEQIGIERIPTENVNFWSFLWSPAASIG